MIQVQVQLPERDAIFDSPWTDQAITYLNWKSRGKDYTVSTVTITHNPEYPTPTISITAPAPGIPLRVYDSEGALLFSTKKGEGVE